ncbi:hypothetical protein I8752_35925 [Nostocaceae cyanobacterium CENA369]|uniref:Uncharacterized protein n=1 Tax=Dendronalium phyllosphericum CENA369 TaxID=1725256 RepID=A0A8J7LHM1_9NOST|nr:hypothetical protein [Dendronalium phyllosphericum]MBH8578242.1 hypothetical protein [Dendronalium phyllosphericum CENA369]
MEPLTTGAIAFAIWLSGKIIDWSTEKALDQAAEKVMQLLKRKFPETANALQAVVEPLALPPDGQEDIGEAVLVEEVKKAAQADQEIKMAVEALGNDVKEATKHNSELDKALREKQSNYQSAITNSIEKVVNLAQGIKSSINIQNQTINL